MSEAQYSSTSRATATSEAAHRAVDRAAARVSATERRLRAAAGPARGRPLATLALAFLSGYLLGLLTQRPSRGRSQR